MSRTQGEPALLRTVVLWITVFSHVLGGSQAALKTTYFDGLCDDNYFQSAWIDLNHQKSGILVSYVSSTDAYEEEDCIVRLKPVRGASVVLSVYQYNLAPEDELTIEDSQKFKVALLGRGDFPDERKSFFSDGVMTLHYKRRRSITNGTIVSGGRRLRFHFVFTQVREAPCTLDEFTCRNRRCIPMKLVCDRHNHCGDSSDQEDCAPRRLIPTATTYPREITTSRYSNVWLVTIIASACIVLVIIVVFSAMLIKGAVNKKKKKAAATAVSRGDAPLTAVAAVRPPNAQSPTAPPAAPMAAAAAPPPSVFGRLRQPFRGHPKNSATRSPEESSGAGYEKYEVPSMYPQLPSVPHFAGVDNPDFKAEE